MFFIRYALGGAVYYMGIHNHEIHRRVVDDLKKRGCPVRSVVRSTFRCHCGRTRRQRRRVFRKVLPALRSGRSSVWIVNS